MIEEYHGGFKPTDKHPPSDWGNLDQLVNVDPENKFVVSTRIRCGRSLQGYPFNPCLTEAQYKEMEEKVSAVFKEFTGELKGTYYPLLVGCISIFSREPVLVKPFGSQSTLSHLSVKLRF